MQHQILQRAGTQGRFLSAHGRSLGVIYLGETRSDDLKSIVINLAAQHLQSFLMSALVRINFGGAVQTFARFLEIAGAAVKVEKLEKRLAIVIFAVGGIKQLTQKLQQVWRGTMCRHQILHQGDKGAALPMATLKLFQLACQSGSLGIEFRIHHGPDQCYHLMDTRWILFEELPDQRLGIDQTVGREQSLGIVIPQLQ